MVFHTDITSIKEYDVIVAGSGPAGVVAAIIAGRQGVKTLIIESLGRLGGVSTSGMMSHFTGNVGNRLYHEVLERAGEKNLFNKGVKTPTIDPELLTLTYIEMLEEANVDILLYTTFCDVIMEGKNLKGIICHNKDGFSAFYSKAVTVETEEIYLTKYAQMAAEHKKHIHLEKPGGVELADFENLTQTVKNNKAIFHTGYMYRYNPYIIELKEQIKNGELGDIISVEAQMNCIHPQEVRQWLKNFPGGMMFFLGCHLVDLIYSIQGMPKRIIPLNKCSGVDGVTSEDFGMAVFEYENGVSFAKTSAVELGGFERRQLVVTGTKKTVELKPPEWFADDGMLTTGRYARESREWGALAEKETSKPFDRYDSMMLSFAKMVRGEKENPWSYDYELELYKVVLGACGV